MHPFPTQLLRRWGLIPSAGKCLPPTCTRLTWFTVSSLRTFQKSDFFMLTSGWRGVWVWGCPILFKQFVVKKTHTQVFAQNKLEKVQTLIDLINPDKTQNIWLFIDPGLTLPWMKRLKRTHKRRRGVRWGLEERAILPSSKHNFETPKCRHAIRNKILYQLIFIHCH